MKRLKTILIIVICLFGTLNVVLAGSIQNSDAAPKFEPEEIVRFSKKVEKILADRKVAVAIVGRIGRSPSDLPPGIQFTHTAGFKLRRAPLSRDMQSIIYTSAATSRIAAI